MYEFPLKIPGFIQSAQEQYLITHIYISLQHVSTCFDHHQLIYLSTTKADDDIYKYT
jgi:hypothetical protein